MVPSETPLDKRLRALVEFLPQFEKKNFSFASYNQPEQGSPVMSPWSLSPTAEAFVQAAYDNGWVRGFNWRAWAQTPEAQELREKPEAVAEASVEQLECLLTLCIRTDRFYDGFLAGAYKSGFLTSILRRAAVLLEHKERVAEGQ